MQDSLDIIVSHVVTISLIFGATGADTRVALDVSLKRILKSRITVAWVLAHLTQATINYLMFSVDKKKSLDTFERTQDRDEYTLLCYVITYENGEIEVLGETTLDEIEEKNELNNIDYITIKYMFNGKLMKYITRQMDIEFPIYNFKTSRK